MHPVARDQKAGEDGNLRQEIVLVVDAHSGAISYASRQAEACVADALGAPAPSRLADWPGDDHGETAAGAEVGSGLTLPGWTVAETRPCGAQTLVTLRRPMPPGDHGFRAIIDNVSLGVVIHRCFSPVYANHAFARLFGFPSADSVLKSDMFDLSVWPAGTTRDQVWEKLLRTRQPVKEWRRQMVRIDGSPVLVDLRYRTIEWDGGPAVIASVSDAAERQHVEERTERLRHQIFEALDAISDGFALWDADDRLIVGNRSMDRVTPLSTGIFRPGISFADAMREHVLAGEFKLAEGETTDAFVTKRTALHQAHRRNREMLNSGGEWYLISERPTSDGGIVGVYTNITQLKAVQADLAAERAKAEAASAAKSKFLAMMSHELRTPMAGIRGVVDLLRLSELSDEQAQYLDQLESSTDSLLTLLNDILDYSKIEAGGLKLEDVPFSIGHVMEEVRGLFDHAASSRGNCLELEIDPAVPRSARGDPGRLRQIVMNLVGNAIKFTENGRISLCVTQTNHGAGGGRFVLKVDVIDTGIGIAEDQLGALFTAFTQADASTTRRFGGIGLGLAICRNLVEAMGGTIGATSTPGEGSTFTFELPLASCRDDAVSSVVRPRSLPRPDFSGVRVLLAEDNALNRSLITAMLRKLGFIVDAVTNGAEALEAVAGNAPYDLVLMDMQMPVMDGPAAVRAIRERGGVFAELPILALTADAMSEHRDGYLAAGLDGILTKPIAWERLAVLAHDMLSRRNPGPQSAVDNERPDTTPAIRPVEGQSEMPLVNRQTLRALEAALGDQGLEAMVSKMLVAARDAIEAIRAAWAVRDLEALNNAAHGLKGMAANFGAGRLAGIAAELEREDGVRADSLIAALTRTLDDTAAILLPAQGDVRATA